MMDRRKFLCSVAVLPFAGYAIGDTLFYGGAAGGGMANPIPMTATEVERRQQDAARRFKHLELEPDVGAVLKLCRKHGFV